MKIKKINCFKKKLKINFFKKLKANFKMKMFEKYFGFDTRLLTKINVILYI